MSLHPRHEDARNAMAARLARLFYDNQFSSDFLSIAGDRFWKEVPRAAGEKRDPSPETRHITLELLRDLEVKRPPRGPSLEEIAGGVGEPSWGVNPPDTTSDGPLPAPEQAKGLPASIPGPSDLSEAPAAGTQESGGSISSPPRASGGSCPPAGIGLSESPRGGQVSLLPPHQKHSETSVAAARSISHETAAMRMRVLAFLRDNPNCTDEEIAEGTGLPANTARPRRVELMQMGQVVQTGKKVARSGRKANAWSIREAVSA